MHTVMGQLSKATISIIKNLKIPKIQLWKIFLMIKTWILGTTYLRKASFFWTRGTSPQAVTSKFSESYQYQLCESYHPVYQCIQPELDWSQGSLGKPEISWPLNITSRYCYKLTSNLLLIGRILSYLINLPGSLIRGHLIILSYWTSDLDLIKMIHYHIWRGLSGIWSCGHYYKVLGTYSIHMLDA